MKTRHLAIIGIVFVIIGLGLIFEISNIPCESNSMVQTIWDHFCMWPPVFHSISSTFYFSQVLILIGIVVIVRSLFINRERLLKNEN